MNTTKMEICSRMSKRLDRPAIELKPIIETFLDEILAVMAEDKRIEIRGFGAFTVKKRKARIGRNPRTGEVINVAAYDMPLFKFSREAQTIFDSKKKPATEEVAK